MYMYMCVYMCIHIYMYICIQADLQHMVSLVEKVVVGGEPKAGETTFAELLPRLRSESGQPGHYS